MNSILTSIKKLLGIEDEYEAFDSEIIMCINSVLMVLNQLGVGPKEGFLITGKDQTWDQFLTGDTDLEAVKNYIHLKVRLMFDPPSNSFVVESFNNIIKEFEWRLQVQADPMKGG